MSHNNPMAHHCMPQKQTHQIAITALRSVAPASGGLGPERIGRLPSSAMALSSASTASTKASTSANASQGAGDVLAGRTAVPMFGPRCYCHRVIGFDARLSGRRGQFDPIIAIEPAPISSCFLQTDSQWDRPALFTM